MRQGSSMYPCLALNLPTTPSLFLPSLNSFFKSENLGMRSKLVPSGSQLYGPGEKGHKVQVMNLKAGMALWMIPMIGIKPNCKARTSWVLMAPLGWPSGSAVERCLSLEQINIRGIIQVIATLNGFQRTPLIRCTSRHGPRRDYTKHTNFPDILSQSSLIYSQYSIVQDYEGIPPWTGVKSFRLFSCHLQGLLSTAHSNPILKAA